MPRNSKTKGGRGTRATVGARKSLKVKKKRAEQKHREDEAARRHRERSRPATGTKVKVWG